MNEINKRYEPEEPEYYDIIPEFNSAGRLCNYHSGDGGTVRVMADEWERFNQLAGRQHEIIDGVVVFNEALKPCLPDDAPNPWVTKLEEINNTCQQIIYAGITMETSEGVKHFSLTEHDQTELLGLSAQVRDGLLPFVPYHADGELCKHWSMEDFIQIAETAQNHIFYHRTYCNHLRAYIKRIEDYDELEAVTYGMALPEDLQASMNSLLGGGVNA